VLRRLTLAGIVSGLAALLMLAPSALAQSGGGCELNGTASFSPGLNTSAQNFTYSFNGNLTSCQSSESGAPSTGSVSAGEIVTINGQQFQEPVATGNGGCSNSTTSGLAIVTWSDGTKTIVQYSTTGALAAVHLQGAVANNVTLQAVNPQPGQPTSTIVTSTRYVGASATGLLAFEPPDPTACNTPAGVTSAGISGVVGLGNTS
jgi:hypothetical protein